MGHVLEMKIEVVQEVVVVVGLWNDDDEEKSMVMEVLGTCASGYLVANSFTNESMLMAIRTRENPQNKSSDIVECPNVSNFS